MKRSCLVLLSLLISTAAGANGGRRLAPVIQHENCNLIAVEQIGPVGHYFDRDTVANLANKGYITRVVTRADYNEMIRQQQIPFGSMILDFHSTNREARTDHIGELILGRQLNCVVQIDFTNVASQDPYVTRGHFNLSASKGAPVEGTRQQFRAACRQAFDEVLATLSSCELLQR